MKTVIYGLNSIAHAFIKSKRNNGNNIFACTNGNEFFQNEKAISLNELSSINKNEIERVVICSVFYQEIYESLISVGIPTDKIFFFDHNKNALIPNKFITTEQLESNDILYAVYDLSVQLACFDVINFAVLAELERRKKKKSKLHFLIVHNREESSSFGTILFHEEADFEWRVEKIIKGVFCCIPSKIAISEFTFREDLIEFIKNKTSIFPASFKDNHRAEPINTLSLKKVPKNTSLSVLCAPKNAKIMVSQFLDTLPEKSKPVVITLREYNSQPRRNSDINEWAKFLNTIDLKEYTPIIIRDTYHNAERPDPRLEKFIHFPQASVDYTIRLALYERAFINMGVSCGPNYGISFIKGARSIIFQIIDEDNPATCSLTAERSGYEIGKNFFFNDNDLQKSIWEKDNFGSLLTNFEKLVFEIENAQ